MPQIPRGGVWLPRLAMATAACAVAAVVALSIVLSGTVRQLNTARAQSQAIASVLAAPDARAVTGSVRTGGKATVLLSAMRREAVVSTSGLTGLPAGKVYELWLIGPTPAKKATAIRPAGLLPAAAAGRTTPVLASGLAAGDKLAMTVEPAGGTSQPTSQVILLLKLSKTSGKKQA